MPKTQLMSHTVNPHLSKLDPRRISGVESALQQKRTVLLITHKHQEDGRVEIPLWTKLIPHPCCGPARHKKRMVLTREHRLTGGTPDLE